MTSSRIGWESWPKPYEQCISGFRRPIPEVTGNHWPIFEFVIQGCLIGSANVRVVGARRTEKRGLDVSIVLCATFCSRRTGPFPLSCVGHIWLWSTLIQSTISSLRCGWTWRSSKGLERLQVMSFMTNPSIGSSMSRGDLLFYFILFTIYFS